jgi:hypothetical protein
MAKSSFASVESEKKREIVQCKIGNICPDGGAAHWALHPPQEQKT